MCETLMRAVVVSGLVYVRRPLSDAICGGELGREVRWSIWMVPSCTSEIGLVPKVQLWMVPIRVGRGTVEMLRLLLIYWEKKSSQRLKGVDVEEKR